MAREAPRHAAIYARVSTTNGQTPDNQLRELRAVAARMHWHVLEEFVDKGISGSKGRDKRPAFDALCRAATQRRIDVVMAWSVDRLGRSLTDLVAFLGDLHAKNVDLYLHRQGIDTTTPGGKALFQMLGVFAEFERALIRERVNAGMARAKAQGKRLGRPRISIAKENRIRRLRSRGWGKLKIARELECGVSTVTRVLAAEEEREKSASAPGQR